MRIGILTFYKVPNYGAMLQAYALLKYLEHRGHQVEFINYSFGNTKRIPLWRCFISRHWFGIRNKLRAYVRFPMTAFATQYPQSRNYETYQDLVENCAHYDAVVVGSDQMWNPKWVLSYLRLVFLDFVPLGCKRISYAPSFGTRFWEDRKEEAGQLLRRFDALSVREKSGEQIVKCLAGCDAVTLLDPTLLWECDFYEKLIGQKHIPTTPYLFAYFLDEWSNGAEEYACQKECQKALNLSVVVTDKTKVDGFLSIPCRLFSVTGTVTLPEWLNRFFHANFVLTNSFHGTVFAILFHKPFIALLLDGSMSGMNERLISLLQSVGLSERMIYAKDFDRIALLAHQSSLDWKRVDQKLVQMRNKAKTYFEEQCL